MRQLHSQLLLLCLVGYSFVSTLEHYGIYQGPLSKLQHGVEGDVYIANENTFIVTKFHYDGSAPDAFFWVGKTTTPDGNGEIAPYGSTEKLGAYSGQQAIVTLPAGFTMSEVKYLSVWCKEFGVDFGNVAIDGSKVPQPQPLGRFPPGSTQHGVASSEIIALDSKTIKVKAFEYDGQAPDAYFLVGKGKVSTSGTKVPVKGQKVTPLPQYTGQDVILELPGDMTVFDIAYLSVYCLAAKENFGNIILPNPSSLMNIPAFIPGGGSVPDIKNLACKTLKSKKMNVYWKKDGNDLQVTLQGRVEELEYLAFGVSGLTSKSEMVGGDVAVAYARDDKVVIGDYYLNKKSACSGVNGVCLDTSQGGKSNIKKGNSEYSDGILTVTYRRPFVSGESQDKPFNLNGATSVIAAIGGVDNHGQVKFHGTFYNKDTILIDFNGDSECEPLTDIGQKEEYMGWLPSKISGETDLRVQLGPTGGKKGYKAITGSESWGIAYYVNGMLIPEITVVRGVTYKFTIEAGDDKKTAYHPFYITTSPHGGAGTPGNEDNSKIIAGVTKDKFGNYQVKAGRLCEFKPMDGKENAWKTANSFAQYKKSLKLNCQAGQPASFAWTPDNTVPDLVYYQCWVHRNLGWKIHVTGSSSKETMSMAVVMFSSLFKLIF